LAACLVVLVIAAPAMAGRPAPDGRYYGLPASKQPPTIEDLGPNFTGMVRVSRSGRRLAAVELRLWCGRGLRTDAVRLSLRGNRAATVRRDGRFSFPAAGSTHNAGRVHLWLSGRFASRQYVRLSYRVRDLQRRRSPGCSSTHERYEPFSPVVLGLDGQPPFSGCRSQRAATLLRTDAARVFQQYAPWVESRPEFDGQVVTHVYACLFARPKQRVDLGRNYDDARVELPRLAGTLLAYEQVGCGLGACGSAIWVRDLAGGGVRTVSPTQRSRFDPESFGVGDLVLKENGALAWTVARYAFGGQFLAYEAWALDSQGARLLDSSPDLDLESLELDGSTLTWTNGGSVRNALLN
jgi:hypothetical protein